MPKADAEKEAELEEYKGKFLNYYKLNPSSGWLYPHKETITVGDGLAICSISPVVKKLDYTSTKDALAEEHHDIGQIGASFVVQASFDIMFASNQRQGHNPTVRLERADNTVHRIPHDS